MSYPYPQDRSRDRQEKGEHPYKDAREAMNQSEAELKTEAEAYGEEHLRLSDAERTEQFEAEVRQRLAEVGDERREAAGAGD
jgi:hypothetical protein